jgi:enediyne biosynthesis protein E4
VSPQPPLPRHCRSADFSPLRCIAGASFRSGRESTLRQGLLPSLRLRGLCCLGVLVLLSGCRAGSTDRATGPSANGSSALFKDVTLTAGVSFRQGHGGRSPLNIRQTIGTGAALLDADGDGWLDLFFAGEGDCALYRNRGANASPVFEEVTAGSGVEGAAPAGPSGRAWTGCAVGDVDGDGRPDLLVTGYRCLRLLLNEGGMKFRDGTAGSGLSTGGWSTSAGFADYDGDGRLDLYVARYLEFGPEQPQLCQIGIEPISRQVVQGACGPELYDPQHGSLYRNLGSGRFQDVTRAAGMADAHGRGLGVVWGDIDRDGRADLYVANDRMPADLYHNLGGGRFRNIGVASGTAYNAEGLVQGGMGVDFADLDEDGLPELLVTTFTHEPKSLYHNEGDAHFTEVSALRGIGPAALPRVGFGARFADFDNDSHLDLIMVNGHVVDTAGRIYSDAPYAQPSLLYLGGAEQFTEATARGGPDLLRAIVGRGLATGDWDNDGRVDVVAMDLEGAPLLLHNQAGAPGHWLRVRLEAARGGPVQGAEVVVHAAGRRWFRRATTGGSYLSASDLRVHVGLGAVPTVDRVEVRWPDGTRQTVAAPPVDRELLVRQNTASGG